MTKDQINHLDVWLQRNKEFSLTIGKWAKRTFLRIKVDNPIEHDAECFYIPLDDIHREIETIN